ncbi:HNH endonuclease [Paenirhodobacter populi]|uniref:HNH endonuclease n=1 Tax=Paenirhodobacter populi TaxID=2306993 RepID=A0A443J8I5_9RHOB|nr:HNH endonuclease [Sinirhodobacter populi]RWR16812.1 HNH endonuclease [Sinirhodobacter populi]
MISARKYLIQREIEAGTGAEIGLSVDDSGLFSAMRIWFSDLDERHGPVADLRPHGLRGHRVTLGFGNFAGATVAQIAKASQEDVALARALVASIPEGVDLDLGDHQDIANWQVSDGSFKLVAIIRHPEGTDPDTAITRTCREVIVPIMAAMAELIGYDVVEENTVEPVYEGEILESVVRRRERNPRNRLLCIRIHGEKCMVCGLEPKLIYGEGPGSIIEVHHLDALSLQAEPRSYDPAIDLVPLCPNCHRAVHTRRPVPLPIDELKAMLGRAT